MILMVVVATDSVDDEPSKQFTTAPFRPLLTGLIVILDLRGKLSSSESLEALKVVSLIITSAGTPLGPIDVKTATSVVIV
jgi:hypothetical protein